MGDHGAERELPRGGLSRSARASAARFGSAREDMATTVERRRKSLPNESALQGRPNYQARGALIP